MKYRIACDIPENVGTLTLRDVTPELAKVEQKLADADAALADIQRKCADDKRAVETLSEQVASGTASDDDLLRAIDRERVNQQVVKNYERKALEARSEVEAMAHTARQKFRSVMVARHASLEAHVEQLRPVLEALRTAESEIDSAIERETRHTTALGVPSTLPGTDALDWPISLMDESTMRRAGALMSGRGRA